MGGTYLRCQMLLQSLSKDIGLLGFIFRKFISKKFKALSTALTISLNLLGFCLSSDFLKPLSCLSLSYMMDLLIPQHDSTRFHLSRWHGALAAGWHANSHQPSASQSGISNNVLRDTVNCIPFSKKVFPGKAQAAKWGTRFSLWQVTRGPFQCRPCPLGDIGSVCRELLWWQHLHTNRAHPATEN